MASNPSHRSSISSSSPIDARFIGNESVGWYPPPTAEPSSSIAGTLTVPVLANPETVQNFIQFVRAYIDQLEQSSQKPYPDYVRDNFDKCGNATKKMLAFAVLAALLDPTSNPNFETDLIVRSTEERFFRVLRGFQLDARDLIGKWESKRTNRDFAAAQTEEETETAPSIETSIKASSKGKAPATPTKGRSSAEKTAQRFVVGWYDNQCIISGFKKPEGAHIVPVRAMTSDGPEPNTFWLSIASFWNSLPTSETGKLFVRGDEGKNILPLSPDAHVLWDQYTFAIRPIEDPLDPQHRMFLQIVWLNDLDTEGGVFHCNWNYRDGRSITDYRRIENGSSPLVKHGDIIEITTRDPKARPLPSFRLLQIQYGVHRMMAGIRAAGALKMIFSGEPPDDHGPPIPATAEMPPVWRCTIDAALDAGILDDTAAYRWGKALTKDWYGVPDKDEEEEEEESD